MANRCLQSVLTGVVADTPGQPVGVVMTEGPLAQFTDYLRPVLARMPKGGVRNVANGAQAVTDTNYWLNTAPTFNGLTYNKVATGVENGVPYADIRVTGTATGVFTLLSYDTTKSDTRTVLGDTFTASMTTTVIAGSLPSGRGSRLQIMEMDSAKAYLTDSASPVFNGGVPTDVVMTRTVSRPEAAFVRCRVQIIVVAGDVVDVTFRIKSLQFEKNAASTPLQQNFGPLDVTEEGVTEIMYLQNDLGHQFLPCFLPGFTTGAATIAAAAPNGDVYFEEKVPVEIPIGAATRVYLNTQPFKATAAYVILDRDMMPQEKAGLLDRWKKRFGAQNLVDIWHPRRLFTNPSVSGFSFSFDDWSRLFGAAGYPGAPAYLTALGAQVHRIFCQTGGHNLVAPVGACPTVVKNGEPYSGLFSGTQYFASEFTIPMTSPDLLLMCALQPAVNSGTEQQVVVDFGGAAAPTIGTAAFRLAVPAGNSPAYQGTLRGVTATLQAAAPATYPLAPALVELEIDLLSGSFTTYINGAFAGSTVGNGGSVAFGDYTLNIGRRWDGTQYFNGNIFAGLGINRKLSPEERAAARKWLADKGGIALL